MKVCIVFCLAAMACAAQGTTEPVWPNGAPGAVGSEDRDKPELTRYLASKDKQTGTAVVVCPGGGYGALAMDHEGRQIAAWLNDLGISAFVLKYRLGPRYRHPAPLADAQRAMQIVRSRAGEWAIAPDRIGIWGFSAGGHLASTVATHFLESDPNAADPVLRVSSRPDFAILAYPVITLTASEWVHAGSKRNLLGDNPDEELVRSLSSELQVTPRTPPTFLFHTTTDTGVPPENSVLFYLALRRAKVPAEMHIYERGRHGVGLAPADPVLSSWPSRLRDWLSVQGLMGPRTQ